MKLWLLQIVYTVFVRKNFTKVTQKNLYISLLHRLQKKNYNKNTDN